MSANDIKTHLGFKSTDRNVYDYLDALTTFGFLNREGVLETAKYSNHNDTDFFLDKNDKTIYLNEVNTIPGFTSISMYPKMWEASGLPYPQLLDELIRLAIEHKKEKLALKTEYQS